MTKFYGFYEVILKLLNEILSYLGAFLEISTVFWFYSESTLPADANCAWLASPGTDFLAFLGAVLCMWRGKTHDDFLVSAFGACVTVIHLCQFVVAKSLF